MNESVEQSASVRRGFKSNIHTALLGALSMAMAAAIAAAQDAAPKAAQGTADAAVPPQLAAEAPAAAAVTEAEAPVAEVVVTGTSIKRADSAALPITALSPDVMGLRDATTPADMLIGMPAVVNVPFNDAAQGGAGMRGDIAAVDLRGIGAGNTLVLLNGRRIAPNAMTSGLDLVVNTNVLPNIGLERVDILRDGASSIYGSDAVAGVINFVTDNKYVGTEVQLQSRLTEAGSGNEVGVNVKYGQNFFDNRLHFTSLFNILYRQELYADEAAGGVDSNKSNLVPGAWSGVKAFNASSAAGKYTSFIGTMPGTGKSATYYVVPTANGQSTITATPTAAQLSASALDVNSYGYSQPSDKRINWFNALDFKLNDKTTLYGEALAYRSETVMERPPVAYGFTSDTAAVVPASNPYNPFGNAFYGAAGVPVTLNYMRFIDDGPEYVQDADDFARVVGGVRGEIAGSWSYDTALMYSIDHVTDTSENAIRESAFEQGSLTQTNPAIAYNPFFFTFAGTGAGVVGTPYTNTAAQLSPFVQHFHQAGVATIGSWDGHVNGNLVELPAGPLQVSVGGEWRFESVAVTRPLYAGLNCLPGPGLGGCPLLSATVFTPEGYSVQSTNNDFIQASAAGDVEGDRTVAATFAETVIPVFSPQNALPLLQKLELSAAVRYEHYSDFGGTTNPKYSFAWRPESHVMFRGSFEHGFRAPTLAALYTPTRSEVNANTVDPYYNGVSGVAPQDGAAGRFATEGPAGSLQPERAESGSFGVVFDVPFAQGLSLSADFWKIHQTGLIASPATSTIYADEAAALNSATAALEAAGTPLASITPDLIATQLGSTCAPNPLENGGLTYVSYHDPSTGAAVYRTCSANPITSAAANKVGKAGVGTLVNVFAPYANMSSATIDGIDYNITYKSRLFPFGSFQVVSDATWLLKYEQLATPDSPIQHNIGRDGAARWRGNLNVLWYYRQLNAGIAAYYVGAYADTGAFLSAGTPAAAVPASTIYAIDGINYWKIVSSLTENAFVSYTWASQRAWLDGTNVRFGVNNITNQRPPFSSGVAGYDTSVYQDLAQGRVWSVELSKRF